jgi:Ras-related protein Rab-8A
MAVAVKGCSYDALFKLMIVGDSGVGKSCLLLRFVDSTFTSSFITTIGIDFKIKTILVDGVRVKLQIWDTAGQERFRTIVTAYYRGAMAVLLVYDVTDRDSFQHVRGWSQNVETHGQDGVYRVLVGNKSDASERAVSTSEGSELAAELGLQFFECSALANLNVDEVFVATARELLARRVQSPAQLSLVSPQPVAKCAPCVRG